MTEGKCAIWGTPSLIEPIIGDFEIHDSYRTGGMYRISDTARHLLQTQYIGDGEFLAKLTTWLIEKRRSGIDCPVISSLSFEEISKKKLLGTNERINRFFLYCLDRKIRPGIRLYIYIKATKNKIYGGVSDLSVFAWTESKDENDYRELFSLIVQAGYISDKGIQEEYLSLTGFQKMEEFEKEVTNSKQAFVAMWFDPSLNDSYESAIEPAIREAGYEPRIIRKVEHNNKIDDEIIAEIRRSKFVIADFTCGFSKEGSEAIARGGVYYEAGFAQGLGLPVIWTCREDIINHVHFDTRQYNHIVWKDAADLKEKLLNRIRATIT